MRRPAAALLAAACLGAGASPAWAHGPAPAPPRAEAGVSTSPRLPVIRPAPDFALRDASGWPVRLPDLRGRVVLISFVYTSCSSACPLLTQRMALLQRDLARARLLAGTHFLSVTVDPERDTADVLRRFATRIGAVADRWRFLRESPPLLGPVLAAYDEWTRARPDGDIDHPARLYLIDRRGDIREIYSLAFFDQRQALVDIRTLLAERPAGR